MSRPVRVPITTQPSAPGPQGQTLTPVVCAATAPVRALSAGRVWMPSGHTARAHVHQHSEIIIYILDGFAATLWGDDMQPLAHGPESMVWIPPGVPHAATNLSSTFPVIALEVRTDPGFNDDVELLPHLDDQVAAQLDELRANHDDLLARNSLRSPVSPTTGTNAPRLLPS